MKESRKKRERITEADVSRRYRYEHCAISQLTRMSPARPWKGRNASHNLAWIKETSPSAVDDAVLTVSLFDSRVLVTSHNDFAAMAFRQGKTAPGGVVLPRPRLRSPDYLTRFMLAVLGQAITWEGNFAVAGKEICGLCRCRINQPRFAANCAALFPRHRHGLAARRAGNGRRLERALALPAAHHSLFDPRGRKSIQAVDHAKQFRQRHSESRQNIATGQRLLFRQRGKNGVRSV